MFFKRSLSQSDIFLIVANLVPVYGVWFLGWNAREVFMIYCTETIIVGLFTLLKMGIVTAIKKWDWWENNGSRFKVHGLFHMLFFLVHYGFFIAIQMFIFSKTTIFDSSKDLGLFNFLFSMPGHFNKSSWIMLSSFIVGYGYKNLTEFILTDEYKRASLSYIMFEPYIRIVVQQFTVIVGSFLLLFGASNVFILFFALVKIFFTVGIDYEGMLKKAAAAQASKASHS
jgi:hypothetical protein